MIVKKLILKKVLSSGQVAEFLLVKSDEVYQAALFMNGKHISGPSLPTRLNPPKDDITHWMGNRPTIGLTRREAEEILRAVENENDVLKFRDRAEKNRK